MYKVRTAKGDFTPTCGHEVNRGEKFLVIEPRSKLCCKQCGIQAVNAAHQQWLDELGATEEAAGEED